MNLHTFKDATSSKRSALLNDLEQDIDDEDVVGVMHIEADGEEDETNEKFNEAGEAIEPFNLKNERDDGYFDENENYVFKKEKGEIDAWVAGMDEVSMERAIGEAAQAVKVIANIDK